MPTENQILGAKIRAARDAYERKHRKPEGGGYSLPPREKVYAHLTRMFGLSSHELSFYFTWSRSCSHEWSEGACDDCPR